MPRKPKSLQSLRKDVEDIVEFGISLERTGSPNATDINLGMRIHLGRIYIVSSDFKKHLQHLSEKVQKLIGKSTIHEEEVEDSIWNLIYSNSLKEVSYKKFEAQISERSSINNRIILPNFQLRFEPGIDELRIGPVRAVMGVKLTSELISIYQDWKLEVSAGFDTENKKENYFSFDAVCWDISVKTSNKNALQQSIWEINIALGLLRLILLPIVGYSMFPTYGDHEVAVGTRPDRRSVVFCERNGGIFAERPGIPPHYKISRVSVARLAEPDLQIKINQVFCAEDNRVAAQVYRGLGWLTRARQMIDRSERYLYFSTAIETILTSSDIDSKITETIGRYGSVVLTDNVENREVNYKLLVKCYAVRSRIVHGGNREVSEQEASLIQEIAENIYQRIILLVNLSLSYKVFQESLKTASFGSKWTIIVQPALTA